MQAPRGAPEWLEIVTAAERPDLSERALTDDTFRAVWPEYNLHGSDTWKYFPAIYPAFAALQILFLDKRNEEMIGRGRTIGIRWNGSLRDLPRGIDDAGLRALNEAKPLTTVLAMAAEIDDDYQGHGLSELMLRSMAMATKAAGLARLIVPARPSWKERYPLMPIGRYAAWRRGDGLPFDPWIRVHIRLGARILRPEPHSLLINATVENWETWTGMAFPRDGKYVFPRCLAPLTVTRGRGVYWEPNIWVEHDIANVEVTERVATPGPLGRAPAGGAAGLMARRVRSKLGRLSRRLGVRR